MDDKDGKETNDATQRAFLLSLLSLSSLMSLLSFLHDAAPCRTSLDWAELEVSAPPGPLLVYRPP